MATWNDGTPPVNALDALEMDTHSRLEDIMRLLAKGDCSGLAQTAIHYLFAIELAAVDPRFMDEMIKKGFNLRNQLVEHENQMAFSAKKDTNAA